MAQRIVREAHEALDEIVRTPAPPPGPPPGHLQPQRPILYKRIPAVARGWQSTGNGPAAGAYAPPPGGAASAVIPGPSSRYAVVRPSVHEPSFPPTPPLGHVQPHLPAEDIIWFGDGDTQAQVSNVPLAALEPVQGTPVFAVPDGRLQHDGPAAPAARLRSASRSRSWRRRADRNPARDQDRDGGPADVAGDLAPGGSRRGHTAVVAAALTQMDMAGAGQMAAHAHGHAAETGGMAAVGKVDIIENARRGASWRSLPLGSGAADARESPWIGPSRAVEMVADTRYRLVMKRAAVVSTAMGQTATTPTSSFLSAKLWQQREGGTMASVVSVVNGFLSGGSRGGRMLWQWQAHSSSFSAVDLQRSEGDLTSDFTLSCGAAAHSAVVLSLGFWQRYDMHMLIGGYLRAGGTAGMHRPFASTTSSALPAAAEYWQLIGNAGSAHHELLTARATLSLCLGAAAWLW